MRDTEFYSQVLGLSEPWAVTAVKLDLANNVVTLTVDFTDTQGRCPECDSPCSLYDHAPERRWRHLDTCQLQTFLVARVPRVHCRVHQVRTMRVPWAEPHGRFTLLFEHLVIQWLKETRSQTAVARRLAMSPEEVHHIMSRAVERGLKRRDEHPVRQLGLDEKSMKKGQCYITVLSDLEHEAVHEVVEGRTQESAESLLRGLTPLQQRTVTCVCLDMWPAYRQAVQALLPQADIVHDRFHVSGHLNAAVDQTRRAEQARLTGTERQAMKHSRYLFLRNFENLTEPQYARFDTAQKVAVKTAQAWTCKETFRRFWDQPSTAEAWRFLHDWVTSAKQYRLPSVTRVAQMIEKHAPGLVSFIKHRATNAIAENLNGQIQLLKATARGFRNFKSYRTNILFHFGKLAMNPLSSP